MPADRRELRRRLFTVAAGQGGHFTAAQAKNAGYSYQAQAHHVGAGNWLRVDRGLFRLTEWVPASHDELSRWFLWSRGRGIVSHETALAVYELGEFESAKIQLTVPPGFTKRADAVHLHRAAIPDVDIVRRPGYLITTPARSLIDVAASGADHDQLARAIHQATERGLVALRHLRSRAEVTDPTAALYIERAIQPMHR